MKWYFLVLVTLIAFTRADNAVQTTDLTNFNCPDLNSQEEIDLDKKKEELCLQLVFRLRETMGVNLWLRCLKRDATKMCIELRRVTKGLPTSYKISTKLPKLDWISDRWYERAMNVKAQVFSTFLENDSDGFIED
uniref:Uncharacterized protein n=1 Tax=Vespula pensylvanica TaxID=30213 RepID=A0A834P5X0_VESPE|nr:hypothetical protein H0235_005956 [Vespula pensylvanica]